LHVPTAAKITVYCFFSLGTVVKLVKNKKERKKIVTAMLVVLKTALVLKAPILSDLARKKVTKKNPPRDAKRLKPPRSTHNPKHITPADRVAQ